MALDFLDRFFLSLEEGNILFPVIIVLVAIILNYKKISDYLEERKRARALTISQALNCDYVSGLTKEHLKEELVTEHFKIATGLRLEKEFRESVINLHKRMEGSISFSHFKKAIEHLEYKDSEIKIKLTWYDKAGFWFNLIFGCILALLGMLIFIVPTHLADVSVVQFFMFVGLGAFFFSTSVMMLNQTFPVRSAKLIKKELDKLNNQ